MSIFDETGGAQPVVARDRSLELFCDRYELIARFVALLNDDPPPRRLGCYQAVKHGLGNAPIRAATVKPAAEATPFRSLA